MSTFTSSGGQQSFSLAGVSNPEINNIDLTLANTEYTIVLPPSTQKYFLKLRDNSVELKLRFVSTGDYVTIPRGCHFSEDGISAISLTIYLESVSASQIVEIITWS